MTTMRLLHLRAVAILWQMTNLKDKRIVVLGGSAGIGFAVAARAAREGARVVIGSSNADHVHAAVAQLATGDHAGHAIDLRSPDAVRALFAKLGAFDHLM